MLVRHCAFLQYYSVADLFVYACAPLPLERNVSFVKASSYAIYIDFLFIFIFNVLPRGHATFQLTQ